MAETQTIGSRRWKRRNLDHLLPTLVQRVHSAEFISQPDIARSYGVYKSTVTHWKQTALSKGLTTARAWSVGLLQGRVNKTLAA